MIREYFLSNKKEGVGPLSEADVIKGIKAGKISLFDMILNQQTGEWVMLMQHPDFSDLDEAAVEDEPEKMVAGLISEGSFTRPIVTAPIESKEVPELVPVQWYFLDIPGQGYGYLQALSLINNKKISEHTLTAQSPQGPWKKLTEWDDFSPQARADFKKNSDINIPELNLRRRYPRFICGKNFLVLASDKMSRMFCSDISQSGMSLIVRADVFHPHEVVTVKFKDILEDNSFDAKGKVISMRRVRIPGHTGMYIRYGVRFTHMTSTGRLFIASLPEY